MRRVLPWILALVFLSAAASVPAQTPAPAPTPPETAQPAPESASAPKPPPIAVVAKATVDRDSCSVGQTVNYHLVLSWTAPAGREVRIQPFEPFEAQGLDALGRSQKSGKTVRGNEIETTLTTRVLYHCAASGKYNLGPLTVAYEDGSGENLSTVAPAVPVEVTERPVARFRQSGPMKYGTFIAAVVLFWFVVLVMRLRRRRAAKAESVRREKAASDAASVWDNLARQAADRPTGDLYARLEDELWAELFRPEPVISGTTATRMAALLQAGVPQEIIDAARGVINACQKARFTAGAVSQGDAILTVKTARETVVDKLRAKKEMQDLHEPRP